MSSLGRAPIVAPCQNDQPVSSQDVTTLKRGMGTLATLGVVAILAAAWSVLVGRLLGPEELGVLAIATLYPVLLATVGHMTFGVATVYDVGQNMRRVTTFAANSLILGLCSGLLLYVAAVATVPVLGGTLYVNVDYRYLVIAFTATISHLVAYQMASVLQGVNIRYYNAANTVRFGLGVTLLLALVALANLGVLGAVIAFAASSAMAAVVSVVLVVKATGSHGWRPDAGVLIQTLRSSSKLHIASVATVIYSQAGLIVANYYLRPFDVGCLYIALVYAQLLALIPQAAQAVLYPRVASAADADAALSSALMSRHAFSWLLIAGVLAALTAPVLIGAVLGEAYWPSLVPLMVMLPGVILSSMAQTLSALWIRRRWYWFMAISGSLIAVVGVSLQIALTAQVGIVGSALAYSLTYLLGFGIAVGAYVWAANGTLGELFVLRRSDLLMYRRMFSHGD